MEQTSIERKDFMTWAEFYIGTWKIGDKHHVAKTGAGHERLLYQWAFLAELRGGFVESVEVKDVAC